MSTTSTPKKKRSNDGERNTQLGRNKMAREYPWTSHAAERSVINKPAKQEGILKVLKKPMTDEQMTNAYRRLKGVPWASDSGLRTLRARLVRQGLIENTGIVEANITGRKSIVWRAA